MAFQIVTSQAFNVPGGYTQWVSLSISGGTPVSVGFQNIGNQWDFWASQMFVQSANTVYVQVVNPSSSSIEWYISTVVSTPSEQTKAAIDSAKAVVSRAKIERR